MANRHYKQDRNLNAIVDMETDSTQVKTNRVGDPEVSRSTADHRRSNGKRPSEDQYFSDDDISDTGD